MTSDQIEYWRIQENSRHNLATESQAKADLEQKYAELDEKLRHNLTDEQIRANLAQLEANKYNLENWKAKQQNTRDWVKYGSDMFYMIFSQMPLDATKGFANWGAGMSGAAKAKVL